MRILVIEDEPRPAEFVRQGLAQAGHAADAADNGATGLEMAATTPYDVVWEVDFDMGSNVIEAHLSQLRRKLDRAFPDLPPLLETVVGHGYRLRDPAPAA